MRSARAPRLHRAGTVRSPALALVPDGDEAERPLLARDAERLAETLREDGIPKLITEGSGPGRTLVALATDLGADLVVVATHGRGGVSRAAHVKIGSVPSMLCRELDCPLLIVPSRQSLHAEMVATGVWRAT